jgi:membrane-associated phospholipid phosphatase
LILSAPHLLHLVTDLGDAILLLPASALVLGYLLYLRSGRAAIAWASTVALCIGLTIVAKLAFLACGGWVSALDIRSPSGHTSLSFTFYAGTALAISADKDRTTRLVLAGLSMLLVLAIAASRIVLEAHTASEVVTGLAIGGACVWWYWTRRGAGAAPIAWEPVVAGFVALALVLHGLHATLERPLARFASELRPAVCRGA